VLNDNITYQEYRYEVYICKPFTNITSTPIHEVVHCITNCIEITNYSQKIKTVNEFDFTIYKSWNDIDNTDNPHFDNIQTGQILLVEVYMDDTFLRREYMYIYKIQTQGVDRDVKNISCYSKHYALNKIKLKEFKNSTGLVNTRRIYTGTTFVPTDGTQGGILDYIIQNLLINTWTVSYVSASIENSYRVFEITEASVLEVIRTIENLYNCIVFFDNYNYTIQVKTYDELPANTGLIISAENYMKSFNQDIKVDEIITRLYVEGKDLITISSVNITGQSYIDDFTYFMTTDYMSQSLIDALEAHDALKDSKGTEYATLQSNLSTAQSELDALYVIDEGLNTELENLQENEDSCIKRDTLIDGHDYTYWHNESYLKGIEIASNNGAINGKVLDIQYINADMDDITDLLAYENNLTTIQLQELLQFINEDTVKCDTSDKTELLQFGIQVLALKASPPIEFSIDMVNVYNYASENFTWNKLILGAEIDVEYSPLEIAYTPRITEIKHNPSGNSLSVTVSTKPYYNDDVDYITAIIANSKKSSVVLEKNKSTYEEYSDDKDTILTTDSVITTDSNPIAVTSDIVLNRRGMFMQAIEDSEITGSMRILEDKIVMSDDNWATYTTAITSHGIYCNALWVLTNKDGSVTINDNELIATNVDFIINSDTKDSTIKLNTTDGIVIEKGTTPVFYADTSGSLYIKNAYIGDDNGIVTITPEGITIKGENTTTMIDQYGIDPRFLDYFKNMIWNSSFEVFDPDTLIPLYWSNGTSDNNSSYYGSYSLKLLAGISTSQSETAKVNPNWFNSLPSRISLFRNQGQIRLQVYDVTNTNYFTLTDSENDLTGTAIDFPVTTSWQDSRCSASFNPSEAGHSGCTGMILVITNIHATQTAYVDGVQMSPDFTGKWSQLYKDGQYSISADGLPDFVTKVEEVVETMQIIAVQDDPPTAPTAKDCWIDTNDYTMYDIQTVTANTTLLISGYDIINVYGNTGNITLTMPSCTGSNGAIRKIVNASNYLVFLSTNLANGNMVVYPKESINLVAVNNLWSLN